MVHNFFYRLLFYVPSFESIRPECIKKNNTEEACIFSRSVLFNIEVSQTAKVS